jgi:hypothetical protein
MEIHEMTKRNKMMDPCLLRGRCKQIYNTGKQNNLGVAKQFETATTELQQQREQSHLNPNINANQPYKI